MDITFTDHLSIEDYVTLRQSAGWDIPHPHQIEAGLKNCALVIVAKDKETTVGLTRLITDGGYAFLIVDVLVLPAYQRQGIGSAMINRALDYVRGTLNDGYVIKVDILSAAGKEGFYRSFGFIERPCDTMGSGMSLRLARPDSPHNSSTPSVVGEQT